MRYMEKKFNEEQLRARLSRLSRWHHVFFLWTLCERMYPNFLTFSELVGYKGAPTLRRALDEVEGWLRSSASPSEITTEFEVCEALAPDTDDYSTPLVSAALNAALGAAFLLKAIVGDSLNEAIKGAVLAIDTIDLFVQSIEGLKHDDPRFEEKIQFHQLMQRELKLQRECVIYLENVRCDHSEAVESWSELNCVGSLSSIASE
jgi:hypothetical protein